MFEELHWDDDRLEHIAGHVVTIGEVLEVLEGGFWSPRWEGDKRRVYGQAERTLSVHCARTAAEW